MPVRGQKPKPDGLKRNRVKPAFEWNDVPDVPFEAAPPLPSRRLGGKAWPAATRRWWAAVSTMPHCVLWTETDWLYAIDTAYVHGQFIAEADMKAEAALFRREKLLGTTVDSRRDLRIRYIDPGLAEADASVTDLVDYRAMLDGG